MEREERIPGVTLWLDEGTILPPGDKPTEEFLAHGRIVLTAAITDFAVWDDVVDKVNGMRIYAVDDFKSEMIEMLQDDVKEADQHLEDVKRSTHEEKEVLQQALDLERRRTHNLDLELRKRTAELEAANEQLAELRELEAQLNALSE